MVRRTKEDARLTRSRLLDAAEHLFQARGVSRTSLQEIASAAGTTRGAIYWHFKDKSDLFNAMLERVALPMEESIRMLGDGSRNDPVEEIRSAVRRTLTLVAHDLQVRRVFEIAIHQVEYVEELQGVKARHLRVRDECVEKLSTALSRAGEARGVSMAPSALAAARGMHALVDGLVQNWLLDVAAFDLIDCGGRSVDLYLKGLGFP